MVVEVYTDASVREDCYCVSFQIYSERYSAICRKYFDHTYDNNLAEMYAIYTALKHLSFLYRSKGFDILLYTDNKNAVHLIENQYISDKYKDIKRLLENLLVNFKSCEFYHIKAHTTAKDVHSKRNWLADRLCKESYKERNSKFYLLYNFLDKKNQYIA